MPAGVGPIWPLEASGRGENAFECCHYVVYVCQIFNSKCII